MWMSAQIHITLTLKLGLGGPFWLPHLKKGGMYLPWCGRDRQYLAARYRSWWSLVLFTKYCKQPSLWAQSRIPLSPPPVGAVSATLFMIKCNVSRVRCAISEMMFEEHTSFSVCERLWSTAPADSCWTHIMGAKFPRAVCKRSNPQPIPTRTLENVEWGVEWGRKYCFPYWEVDLEPKPQRSAGVSHTIDGTKDLEQVQKHTWWDSNNSARQNRMDEVSRHLNYLMAGF